MVLAASFTSAGSRQRPGYNNMLSKLCMAGEVGRKGIPQPGWNILRSQPSHLITWIVVLICCEALKYKASSPNVQLCLTGIDHLPIKEALMLLSMGPSVKDGSPETGLGLSSMMSVLLLLAAASIT